jgi:hypothetical protein
MTARQDGYYCPRRLASWAAASGVLASTSVTLPPSFSTAATADFEAWCTTNDSFRRQLALAEQPDAVEGFVITPPPAAPRA